MVNAVGTGCTHERQWGGWWLHVFVTDKQRVLPLKILLVVYMDLVAKYITNNDEMFTR